VPCFREQGARLTCTVSSFHTKYNVHSFLWIPIAHFPMTYTNILLLREQQLWQNWQRVSKSLTAQVETYTDVMQQQLRKTFVNNGPTRCNNIQFIYSCKLLYMFRVVTPLIIRSSYHCICNIWHYCYLSWTWLDGNALTKCWHLKKKYVSSKLLITTLNFTYLTPKVTAK
jgi:hypothetical protein